jgi:hypothetical protein
MRRLVDRMADMIFSGLTEIDRNAFGVTGLGTDAYAFKWKLMRFLLGSNIRTKDLKRRSQPSCWRLKASKKLFH